MPETPYSSMMGNVGAVDIAPSTPVHVTWCCCGRVMKIYFERGDNCKYDDHC
jgi:hypothetical protein